MKKKFFAIILALVAIATTVQAQTYTITVSAYPEDFGTVSGGGTYAYGDTVTLTATPKEGHYLQYWSDGQSIVSKNSTYSFTVTGDRELTAWFGGGSYTVRVTAEGGGDVKVGGKGEEITVEGGRPVTAKAIPHNDYFFAGWIEADKWVPVNKWSSLNANNELEFVSRNPEFYFIVGKDRHLKAVFLPQRCNLKVWMHIYDRDKPHINKVLAYNEWRDWGVGFVNKIVPPDGNGFVEWTSANIKTKDTSGAIIVNDSVVSFGVQPIAQAATLAFVFRNYDLRINASASSEDGGTVSGGGSFDYGEEVTLTATPNEGYQFVCWTENQLIWGAPSYSSPIEVSTEASYTFTVSRSRNLTAVFVENPYPLWVGDTQVDSSNKDNILGAIDPATNEPTAAYDPETKTLTLHNPTISGAYQDYKIYSEDSLTIEGEATITGDKGIAVVSKKEELNTLTIQNAELDISAQWEAIYARNTHVCMNSGTVNAASALHRAVNVQVHGSFTMNGGELVIDSDKEGLMVWRGNQQAYVDGENNIVINGGRIDAKSVTNTPIKAHGVVTLPAAYYAHLYGGDTPLSLEHVELNDNYGIYYNSCFVDESGERITGDRIVIEPKPIAKYDLWIGDTQVDEANKDDIPGVTGENAKASFDPATNTLTLENVTGVTGSTMGALITAEGINLTVECSAVLEDKNIDMGIQVAPGSLTLNGDFTISAGSYGIYVQKDVTMAKGRLFAKGKAASGIYSARGALKVNGGTVEASGSMWAVVPNPDLSGNTGEYEVLVNEDYYTAAAGASPWSGDDVNDPLGGFSSPYKYVKIIHIPTLVLLDDDSEATQKNHELIRANLGEQVGKVNVRIEGRTLYKTGHWNTLMLPFSLASFAGTLLEDADVRELVPDECAYANGTLTLKFAAVSAIEANKPYIVRWAASEENIVNPLFANVFLEDGIRVIDLFEGGILFFGTYDTFAVPELELKHYLYMGSDSKLYYPLAPMNINAFCTFFILRDFVAGESSATDNEKEIRNIVLDFGNGETTGIDASLKDNEPQSNDHYYSIDGQRLQGKPTKKGIYIKNGKKVVVK